MAKSIITGKIFDSEGTGRINNIQIIARLKPVAAFRSLDDSVVYPVEITNTDAAGDWSLSLERNTDITPVGTYWLIEERIPGDSRLWNILVGATNQNLFDALVEVLPDAGQLVPWAQAVGGVLAGNLPNPTFAVDMATQAELDVHIAVQAAADALRVLKAGDTMTGPLLLPDGSVGAPGLAFSGDSDTGFRRSGSGVVVMVSDGADVTTWNASGVTTTAITANGSGSGTAAFQAPHNRISSFGASAEAGKILLVSANAAANIPLVLRGAAAQSANLLEWQNSAGSVLARVGSGGDAGFPTIANAAFNGPLLSFQSSYIRIENRNAVGNIPLVVRGMASQVGDLLQWQDSASTVLARMTSAGWMGINAAPAVQFEVGGALRASRIGVPGQHLELDGGGVGGPLINLRSSSEKAFIMNNIGTGGAQTELTFFSFQTGGIERVRITPTLLYMGGSLGSLSVVTSTSGGTMWATASTQKQSWWGATPVVQPAAVADATGGAVIDAEARTALNALLARLRTIGLITT